MALEQIRKQNDSLKANNDAMKDEVTQLKANNDRQKVEIAQLTTVLDKMASNNEDQMQQINSQLSEIDALRDENKQLKAEVQQLKVSHKFNDSHSEVIICTMFCHLTMAGVPGLCYPICNSINCIM